MYTIVLVGYLFDIVYVCIKILDFPCERLNSLKLKIKSSTVMNRTNCFSFFLLFFFAPSAKSLRTPSNMFVVNLAICDFFMMIKAPIFIYNAFNTGFATGHIGCQIFAFIGSLTGIGAGMTNAAIAYDRYR